MGRRIATLASESGIEAALAGRPSPRLTAEAGRLEMEWRSSGLAHPAELDAMLANVHTVINTAGPFAHTASALMRACILNRSHYLDLSNEASTFHDAWSLDSAAREAGVNLVPGAGLGTVAAETLAAHVLRRIQQPDTLSIVRTTSHGTRTPGVNTTMLELLAQPGAGVKNGRWNEHGPKIVTLDLPEGRRAGIPVAVGDAYATAHATGIRNVTAYSSTRLDPRLVRLTIPLARRLGKIAKARTGLRTRSHNTVERASDARTRIWIQASNPAGDTATSYLQCGSGSELAALIAVQAAQKLHSRMTAGTHTAGELFSTQGMHHLPGIQIVDL